MDKFSSFSLRCGVKRSIYSLNVECVNLHGYELEHAVNLLQCKYESRSEVDGNDLGFYRK